VSAKDKSPFVALAQNDMEPGAGPERSVVPIPSEKGRVILYFSSYRMGRTIRTVTPTMEQRRKRLRARRKRRVRNGWVES